VTTGRSVLTTLALLCVVLGCAQLALSERAWIKPLGNHGDDVMVRCNDTLETWYLSCQGNQWIGYYDNCTAERKTRVFVTVRTSNIKLSKVNYYWGPVTRYSMQQLARFRLT